MDFEQKETEGTENAGSLHFGVGTVLALRHGGTEIRKGKVNIRELARAAEQSANMREHGLFLKFSGGLRRGVYIFLKPRIDAKKRE